MNYRILIIGSEKAITETTLSKFGFENVDSIEIRHENMQDCLIQMGETNLIVTLKDWETDPESTKLAQIARIAEIPVVHEINFASYVQSKDN